MNVILLVILMRRIERGLQVRWKFIEIIFFWFYFGGGVKNRRDVI